MILYFILFYSILEPFCPSEICCIPFLAVYIYIRYTLGPIFSVGRTAEPFCPSVLPAEPFCPSEIRFIPFFSYLYIYGALWGPSVLPAERQNRSAHQFCQQNDRTVLPIRNSFFLFLAIYIYTLHFGAHQFFRQNGRTVLPLRNLFHPFF